MKKICFLLVTFALASCSSSPEPDAGTSTTDSDKARRIELESGRLNAWFETQFEEELAFSPISLSFLGRKEQYGRIDDLSEVAEEAQLEWKRLSVADMKKTFNYDHLSTDAKISYDLWEYQYQQEASSAKFRRHDYIFDQMNGAQSFLPTFLINFHEVETEQDMVAYISRISGVALAMDQLIERARLAADDGIRPPRFAYEGVIEQAGKVLEGQPFSDSGEAPIWADAQRKLAALLEAGALNDEQMENLKGQALQALNTDFGPAYQRLIEYIESELDNTDASGLGASALPNGEAYYNHRLQISTTTDMSAEEIHQLGLLEVARIRAEMESIREAVDFDGDLKQFFSLIRDSKDDSRFFYPDTDEGRQAYIDDATLVIDNIKTQLPNYFGITPGADLVVRRVESFREQPGAAQHYYPGTPDGSRPGTYYAHLSDMTAMPKNQLEVIAYHEGVPGHHMQIAIAQELETVPTFRTQAGFTAYIEGWALYAELLAREMPSTYQDPYSDLGRLTSEMWRAVRLVVDTGLHAKGWSAQQAIDYFASNTPEPLESITSEVQRYLVMPGQATSYKIGMLDILRLRTKSEQALGEKFDIRVFHDTILGGGALPLELLERQVDNWIAAAQKNNKPASQ